MVTERELPDRRPFRFGAQVRAAATAGDWADLARWLEDVGVSTMTRADHFDEGLDPFVALTAAANATTTLRVGTMVLANDFRHPVVTARSAAALDLLSAGRLELGLGAGWKPEDYDGAGIRLDRPGERIERLAEACTVIRSLLDTGAAHHDGQHYRVHLDAQPLPAGRIPLVVGGGGPRMLRLAGRVADTVALNVNLRSGALGAAAGADGTFERTVEKLGWVREGAGDRFAELELQARVHFAAVTDERDAVAAALADGFGLTVAEALRTPHALVGTVDQICDQLVRQRDELGISYLGLSVDAVEDLAPVIARLAGT